MKLRWNNEAAFAEVRAAELCNEENRTYVKVDLDNGKFLTVVGDADELKRFLGVLENEYISCDLDDFVLLNYYEDMTMEEIVAEERGEDSDGHAAL